MKKITKLTLIRHGTTEWSLNGRHTSFTDLDLLPQAKKELTPIKNRLKREAFDYVCSSPMQRARNTAKFLGFSDVKINYDLLEWNYGDYEGLTTQEIRSEKMNDWTVFVDGCPNGESPKEISDRMDRLLGSLSGNCLLFIHGHCGRALIARWLQLPVEMGAHFELHAGKLTELSFEREMPTIKTLNLL